MTSKDLADAKVPAITPRRCSPDYEQTCLPFTFRHTGRRRAGLTAAAAGRGGGACRAAGIGRGGGDVFIVCTGGLTVLAGGGVLTVPTPLDGAVLVTLAPTGGVPFALCSFVCVFTDPVEPIVFVTFAPGGGPLARKSLAGGEVTAVPAAGDRSGTCLPTPDAGGELMSPWAGAKRGDGGKPTPVRGAIVVGEVLTGARCARPGGGAGRLKPLAGARANAGSGRNGGGGGACRPPNSTTGRATSGGGRRTSGGGLITTTGPRRGGGTATTPSAGGRGVSQ